MFLKLFADMCWVLDEKRMQSLKNGNLFQLDMCLFKRESLVNNVSFI